MATKVAMAAADSYTSWLTAARQALSTQQHVVYAAFSADNTAVYFDEISYATCKVMPEQRAEQE